MENKPRSNLTGLEEMFIDLLVAFVWKWAYSSSVKDAPFHTHLKVDFCHQGHDSLESDKENRRRKVNQSITIEIYFFILCAFNSIKKHSSEGRIKIGHDAFSKVIGMFTEIRIDYS